MVCACVLLASALTYCSLAWATPLTYQQIQNPLLQLGVNVLDSLSTKLLATSEPKIITYLHVADSPGLSLKSAEDVSPEAHVTPEQEASVDPSEEATTTTPDSTINEIGMEEPENEKEDDDGGKGISNTLGGPSSAEPSGDIVGPINPTEVPQFALPESPSSPTGPSSSQDSLVAISPSSPAIMDSLSTPQPQSPLALPAGLCFCPCSVPGATFLPSNNNQLAEPSMPLMLTESLGPVGNQEIPAKPPTNISFEIGELPYGHMCRSTCDCKDGLLCDFRSKRCRKLEDITHPIELSGTGKGAFDKGEACLETSDCKLGLICRPDVKVCAMPMQEGTQCGSVGFDPSWTCREDLSCVNRRCVKPAPGEPAMPLGPPSSCENDPAVPTTLPIKPLPTNPQKIFQGGKGDKCRGDCDCLDHLFCRPDIKICAMPMQEGDQCGNLGFDPTWSCMANLTCANRKCAKPAPGTTPNPLGNPATGIGPFRKGKNCQSNADCIRGLICRPDMKMCAMPMTEGTQCGEYGHDPSWACTEDLSCVNSRCVKPPPGQTPMPYGANSKCPTEASPELIIAEETYPAASSPDAEASQSPEFAPLPSLAVSAEPPSASEVSPTNTVSSPALSFTAEKASPSPLRISPASSPATRGSVVAQDEGTPVTEQLTEPLASSLPSGFAGPIITFTPMVFGEIPVEEAGPLFNIPI